ncbi:MAG TPA: hypothetical protein VHZ31_01310 [Solirubrobacteraceae bacterium]|jgi:hypothetical protein|nr:hypothetical protein [Solirubrobacteraceae bacterium]
MALRRLALVAVAVAGAALAFAGPAQAVDPPSCDATTIWARPGIAHVHELSCWGVDSVELASPPQHARLEGLVLSYEVKFRLTPDASSPEDDAFTLHLTGQGGTTDQVIHIDTVPLSRNTPPHCYPVSVAQRTSAATPTLVGFEVSCLDDEHDDFTIYGGGPGTHPDAPLFDDGHLGSTVAWHYLPTIASGQEQTTYYAVDELGARSADAPISVEVGPAVDRRPLCSQDGFFPIPSLGVLSRPGATRHVVVYCGDADRDPVVPRVAIAPSRGDLTAFDVGPLQQLAAGSGVRIDATYVPRTPFEGSDQFAVVAGGPRGDGSPLPVEVTARALPANEPATCWASPAHIGDDPEADLTASCRDDDGDPITAALVTAPAHGHAAAPVVRPDYFAPDQDLSVGYTPDPGYVGHDALTVAISDASGVTQTLELTVTTGWTTGITAPYTIGEPYAWPELSWPSGPTWQPSVGQALPVTPVEQARRALGTRAVRLVARVGDAGVYARRDVVRASAHTRALAVTCPVRCAVTSRSSVAGRGAGAVRHRVSPGRAAALSLALSSAQRARVRRAGHARVLFRLTVTRTGGKPRRATVRVALRG